MCMSEMTTVGKRLDKIGERKMNLNQGKLLNKSII